MASTGSSSVAASQNANAIKTLKAAVEAAGKSHPQVKEKPNVLRSEDVVKLVGVAKDNGITADEFAQTLSDSGLKLSKAARKSLDSPELRKVLSPADEFQATDEHPGSKEKGKLRSNARSFMSKVAHEFGIKRVVAAAMHTDSAVDPSELQDAMDEVFTRVQDSERISSAWEAAQPLLDEAVRSGSDKFQEHLGVDIPLAPKTSETGASSAAAEDAAHLPHADLVEKTLAALRKGGFAYAVAATAKYASHAAEAAKTTAASDPDRLSAMGVLLAESAPHIHRAMPIIGNVSNIRALGAAAEEMWKAAKTGSPGERIAASFYFVATVVGLVPGWQAVGAAARVSKNLWDAMPESSAATPA